MRREPNFEILKEPRGFIKLLEIGIAIFAFSTTAGYYSEFKVTSSVLNTSKCNDTMLGMKATMPIFEILAKFEYSFAEENYYISVLNRSCHFGLNGGEQTRKMNGKYKAGSEFFVCIGVMTFLYCLIAVGYYVMFEDQEENMYATDFGKCSFIVIDFIVSVILVVFWFISSTAWTVGLSAFKDDTDPANYITSSPYCSTDTFHCTTKSEPNYATLKVSVILGFLNLFVWLGNLWFLFKETPWHNPRQAILHDNSVQ